LQKQLTLHHRTIAPKNKHLNGFKQLCVRNRNFRVFALHHIE